MTEVGGSSGGVDFRTDEDEIDLKLLQDRICRARAVSAVAYQGECPPPYVAHVYLLGDVEPPHVWAGTVWQDDRWPSIEEITDALTRWRGQDAPVFSVEWWKDS